MRLTHASLLGLVVAVSCSPSKQVELASLCVERPEQHGRLNIIPVSIALTPESGDQGAQLVIPAGGSRTCVELPAGPVTAALRFPYPYSGPSEDPPYWETRSPFSLRPGANTLILDTAEALDTRTPGWSETGWHDMWDLRRARPGETVFIL